MPAPDLPIYALVAGTAAVVGAGLVIRNQVMTDRTRRKEAMRKERQAATLVTVRQGTTGMVVHNGGDLPVFQVEARVEDLVGDLPDGPWFGSWVRIEPQAEAALASAPRALSDRDAGPEWSWKVEYVSAARWMWRVRESGVELRSKRPSVLEG